MIEYLTPRRLGQIYGITRATLRRLERENLLRPLATISGSNIMLYQLSDVERFVQAHKVGEYIIVNDTVIGRVRGAAEVYQIDKRQRI